MFGKNASLEFLAHAFSRKYQNPKNNLGLHRKLNHIEHDRDQYGIKFTEYAQKILKDLSSQLEGKDLKESDKDCPECRKKMSFLQIDDTEIEVCTECGGCWFDPGELMVLSKLPEDDTRGEFFKSRCSKYECPECQQKMSEFVFLRPYNLMVDRCQHGHGVYLEKAELEHSLELCDPLDGK